MTFRIRSVRAPIMVTLPRDVWELSAIVAA
jgi:hypothetical protein